MARFNVQSGSTTTPVAEPGFGQAWLVPAGAIGDWSTHEDEIAIGNGNEGYTYLAPSDGDEIFVVDTDTLYLVTDSGTLRQIYPATAGSLATDTLADAKGDIFVATGSNAIARVPIGANGLALIADSAESAGVRWGHIARLSMPPIAGEWYSPVRDGTGTGNLTLAADRVEVGPHFFEHATSIDRLAINVQTAAASSNLKIVVYASASNGRPGALLHESASIDSSTTGWKEVTVSLSFAAGQVVWLGIRSNGTPTILCTNASSDITLGLGTSSGNSHARILRLTGQTFANAAPDPWTTYAASQLVAFVGRPFIIWRAA